MSRRIRFASLPLTGVLALIAVALAAVASPGASTPLTFDAARITLAGTSNIHEYTASTTTVRVTRVEVAPGAAGADFWDALTATPGTLTAFEFSVPAASLKSAKDGLDKNMHKALKVKTHADITFRLLRLEPRQAAGLPPSSRALRATGMLGVAGVEKEVAIDLTTEKKDAALAVRGEIALLMTDFGIAPPKALMGMLKTDPKVTVRFETVLAVPLT